MGKRVGHVGGGEVTVYIKPANFNTTVNTLTMLYFKF